MKGKGEISRKISELERDIQLKKNEIDRLKREIKTDTNETTSDNANEKALENLILTRDLIANYPGIIYIFDLIEMRNVYINRRITDILGYSVQDIKGFGNNVLKELMHPDDYKNYTENILPGYFKLKPDEVLELEYRMKSKEGKYFWFQSREVIYKYDSKGKAQQIFGFINNLTRQREVEKNFIEANERLVMFADNIDETLWVMDKALKFTYMSPSCYVMSGYTVEEALKRPFMENFTPKSQKIIIQTLSKRKNNLEKGIHDNKKKIFNLEQIHKNGDILNVSVKTIPLFDDDKNFNGFIGITRNVDNEVKAKQAQRSSEEKYRTLVENANDIIFEVTTEGSFSYLSPNVKEMLGYNLNDVLGKPFFDYVHPDDLAVCLTYFTKLIESNEKQRGIQYRLKHIDGSWKWHTNNASPILDENGNAIAYMGISRDISDTKKYEKELVLAKERAEESDRLKTEFLNNLSHEIRTPMNGIVGFSGMLSSDNLSEEKRANFIKIIQNSSHQLLKIIDDILEISTLESKQPKIIEEEFLLNDFMMEMFSVYSLISKERNIPLYLLRGLKDNQSRIITDISKLNKIMRSLLSNALKYTTEGYVEFGYKLKGKELELFVRDTGIGISPEKHKEIFERFSQEQLPLASKHGGLGLGLSIARENARLIGGEIFLESERGKGSSFFVRLPFKSADKDFFEKYNEQQNRKIPTILIVEDEEVNYLFMEALLDDETEEEYNILYAKSGEESVRLCKECKDIDLVLMDIKMPGMDGLEATRKIKSFSPDLPVIAQTAYTSPSDLKDAQKSGCDDVLSKPIKGSRMIELINRYLLKE